VAYGPSDVGSYSVSTTVTARQIPLANRDTKPFWDGCLRDELLLQRCTVCQAFRHPPSPICHVCLSDQHEWVRASGRGTIYTFVVVHQPLAKGWETLVPYVVAVIDLDEGPKFLTNMVNVVPGDVAIGMPVEVVFEAVGEMKMPMFQPQGVGVA
jgi:uncharacterized protein